MSFKAKKEPEMVTFEVKGFEGVCIAPSTREIPQPIIMNLITYGPQALPELFKWLPPGVESALQLASIKQLENFLEAWKKASKDA